MAAPTINEIINTIAPISQFLSANDIYKSGLYGGGVDIRLPRKLYMIRKNCQWLYDQDPNDETLIPTSNYLYALCGKYSLQAQRIAGGSGSTATIIGGEVPDPIEFEVDASSFIATGGTSKTFPVDWEGFNLLFVRNEIPQGTIDLGGTYYSWDKNTREFTCSPALIVGEHIFFMPVG